MPSNATYICIADRRSARRYVDCPDCHQPMRNMGKRFRVPPRRSKTQWKKIGILLDRFGGMWCGSPKTITDAKTTQGCWMCKPRG